MDISWNTGQDGESLHIILCYIMLYVLYNIMVAKHAFLGQITICMTI